MAYMREVVCQQCHNKYGEVSPPEWPYVHICPACTQIKKDADKKAHFDQLDALTVEERLRRIEEWIYNYKPPINVRDVFF